MVCFGLDQTAGDRGPHRVERNFHVGLRVVAATAAEGFCGADEEFLRLGAAVTSRATTGRGGRTCNFGNVDAALYSEAAR